MKVLQIRNILQRRRSPRTLKRHQETPMHRASVLAIGALCLLSQAASATTKESDHFIPVELMSDQIIFADIDSKETTGATTTIWSLVVFAQPTSFGNVQGTIAETNWSFDCQANTYSEVKDVVFDDAGNNVYSADNTAVTQPDDPQTVEGAMLQYACKGTERLSNSSTYDSRTDAIKIGQYQFHQMPTVPATPPAPPATPAPPPAGH